MINEIRQELRRVGADDARAEMDERFDPQTGPLVRIEIGDAFWHMLPWDFVALIRDLPTASGSGAVHRAIESQESQQVWHGPAPEGSRDA